MLWLQYLKLLLSRVGKDIFLPAFVVVSLDIITTYIGLHVGLCERNQNVVNIVNLFGLYGLLLWYPVELLCVYFAAVVLRLVRYRLNVVYRFEYICILIMCYVVVNNTILILSNTVL